jgi:hypothetical protein
VQLIVKLTAAPAVTGPDGAPMMEQLSAPGGVVPQVIVKLPLPSGAIEHAVGTLRVQPVAGEMALGEINKKANVALASRALARVTKDRIMCTPLKTSEQQESRSKFRATRSYAFGIIPLNVSSGQMQRRLYGGVHTIASSMILEKCRIAAHMNRERRHMNRGAQKKAEPKFRLWITSLRLPYWINRVYL